MAMSHVHEHETLTNAATMSSGILNDIVTADPKMLRLVETAQSMSRHKAAVLITGETGVGKELIARIIHEHSPRRGRPWVDLNCAALPEHLVESELFGYEKGAFSGANNMKPGLFEVADGGTLFLDEIGELDAKVQVKLLRVLDGQPYYRLGGSRKISVDVRVIAATNRDLKNSVREGAFRPDLYHRVNELNINVPPLRERPEDIIALAQHFLLHCRPEASFTADALESLLYFEWHGNVRELRNVVLKLAILTPRDEINAEDIRQHFGDPEQPPQPTAASTPEVRSIAEMERLMIERALEMTGGNQSLAAEQLGMPRRTFVRKLSRLQIQQERRNAKVEAGSGTPPDRRKELHVPITITTSSGRNFAAAARNLSLGGLGLQIQPPLEGGEELTIGFTLPGSRRRVELKGAVAWSQPTGLAGIRFSGMSDAKAEVLSRWMQASHSSQFNHAALAPASEPTVMAQPQGND
jgi:DNA-binding NtrC family response regulator